MIFSSKHTGLLLLLLTGFCLVWPAPVHGWDEEQLLAGEMAFVVEDTGKGNLPRFRAAKVVDCPPAEVWGVVNDYDHFKDFIPGVVESRVEKREGDTVYFYERDHVPVLADTWYLLRCEHDEEKLQKTMTMVEGSIDSLEATWTLKPFKGDKTLLEYSLHTDPGLFLPRWAQKMIVKKTAGNLFQGISNRACAKR